MRKILRIWPENKKLQALDEGTYGKIAAALDDITALREEPRGC
jgi:hypothetical protein